MLPFYHLLNMIRLELRIVSFSSSSSSLLWKVYRLGMVMGRGRALRRIWVGCRKPDGRGISLPVPFVSLPASSGGAMANVEFPFDFVANVEFNDGSHSGLFRLPLELPDERLCGEKQLS